MEPGTIEVPPKRTSILGLIKMIRIAGNGRVVYCLQRDSAWRIEKPVGL